MTTKQVRTASVEPVRNEAAERLRDRMLEDGPPIGSMFWNGWDTAHDKIAQLLDEALAAERRATVERIRERLTEFGFAAQPQVLAILDEEAGRG